MQPSFLSVLYPLLAGVSSTSNVFYAWYVSIIRCLFPLIHDQFYCSFRTWVFPVCSAVVSSCSTSPLHNSVPQLPRNDLLTSIDTYRLQGSHAILNLRIHGSRSTGEPSYTSFITGFQVAQVAAAIDSDAEVIASTRGRVTSTV